MADNRRGIYWTKKHEDLCVQWKMATTQQEFTKIHGELSPALNIMSETIMQRYFQVPVTRHVEYKKDLVTHVFLNLKTYNPDLQKAYTYCGTLIRNHLYDIIVRLPNRTKTPKLETIGEEDTLDRHEIGIDYGEAREIDYKAIEAFFITKRDKLLIRKDKFIRRKEKGRLGRYESLTYDNILLKYNNWIKTCNLCLEYMDKFESINPDNMAEYVFLNIDLKKPTVVILFRTLFNINVTIPSDTFVCADEKKGYNHMNDDYCYQENKNHKRHIRRKRKENGDYSYF